MRQRSNTALPMQSAQDFCRCFQAVDAHITCCTNTKLVDNVCDDRVYAFGTLLASCWHIRTLGWNKSEKDNPIWPSTTSMARRSFLASFHNWTLFRSSKKQVSKLSYSQKALSS